jgi:hypothetical protein
VLAAALLLLAGPLLGLPQAAAAQRTVPFPGSSDPVRLQLTQLTPRVVTGDGPTSVTVVGTLRNGGDRPVGELEVRLQRGDALRTEGNVRDVLAGSGRADVVTPAFTPLPGTLEPGGELPVRLTVPLLGQATESLALTRPGVYEVLVNVNGVPSDGGRARLAAVRLLLPVLSLPGQADPRPGPPDPDAPPAAGLTVLYPVVDVPRRLPTVPGEQTLLTDDDLARSFAPDGRLGGLVAAFGERAPPGSAVRAATCLAVDPDLVATAAAMRQGYAVRTPTGTVPGTGAEVAGAWLDGLSAATRDGCVVALPFADADLVALARGNLGELGERAVSDGFATTAEILGTAVLDDITWPADEVLDEAALGDVAAGGAQAVVLSPEALGDGVGVPAARGGVVSVVAAETSPMSAVLADPLLSRAASVAARAPASGIDGPAARSAAASGSARAAMSAPLATQDALAALVFRAQRGAPAGADPLVLAPPHRWTTDATGARALLDAVGLLVDTGRVQPRPLADVVEAGPAAAGPPRRPVDPLQITSRDIPTAVVETVREVHSDVTDLRSAAVPENDVGATLDATFAPLEQAVLRPVSAAWHGRPDLARSAAADAAERIADLRDSVRVLAPPSPYSLGTSDAPLLVTVANGLPVTMEVRLSISSTTGLRTAPIPPQRIPPLGRRQVQVSAEVVRSGQFSVEATVRTPSGRPLGPPSRLLVRSTAYGTITLWLTGSAGVLLVVLAAVRVVRRIRGEPGSRRSTGPTRTPPPADRGGGRTPRPRALLPPEEPTRPVPTTEADLRTRPIPAPPRPGPPPGSGPPRPPRTPRTPPVPTRRP